MQPWRSPAYVAAAAMFLSLGAAPAAGQSPAPDRPRLAVLVSVDQMIPEQLERLGPLLRGGLGRFVHQGLVFRSAQLQYGDTETGPGHATYGTGVNPVRHGIVGNDWILPEEKTPSYCVADPLVHALLAQGPAGKAGGMSPRNLRAPGLIDRLRLSDPAAKAVAISIKDRAAIAMSGQRPDAVLWWDRTQGGFMSSTWYGEQLPPWAREFDARWVQRFQACWGAGWSELPGLSLDGTDTDPDDSPGEVDWRGKQVVPYAAPAVEGELDGNELAELAAVVYGSPAGDQFVCELALDAVAAMELGADQHPDVLCLSLSACDTVGHSFGPRSREVTDVLLRADRELGRLFDELDRRVGAGRWVASLSSDHGVMDLPEALVARGVGAERVSSKRVSSAIKKMRKELTEEYGEDFFLAYDSRGVRLSWTRIQAAGRRPVEVRAFAAKVLEEEAASWLEQAWTLDEVEAVVRGGTTDSGWLRAWANSFDEERTPDLVIQSKPWKLLAMGTGTTHGTPYPYDRRIPLAFYGPGFPAGERFEPASSLDAVPSLLAALRCTEPAALEGLQGTSRRVP